MSSSQQAMTSPLIGPNGQPVYADTAKDHYPLTFGVEFELALAHLHPPVLDGLPPEDPDPEDTRGALLIPVKNLKIANDSFREIEEMEQVQCHIRNTINTLLGSTRSSIAESYEDDTVWLYKQGSVKLEDLWNISDDLSVRMPAGEHHYAWKGMEINTPALYYSESMLLHVQSVCSKLLNTYRINTNPSTSMHVHVGFCKKGYELHELKNLLSIWWVFEPQFFSLVEPHRRENRYCHQARHATLLFAKLRMKNVQLEAQTQAGLDMILATKDIQELVKLWKADSRGLYTEVCNLGANAEHLRINPRAPYAGKMTVEFRLHEGCLEPEEVRHWIKFCCGLVAFAAMVDAERLMLWIRECRDREVGILGLLKVMRMSEQADWFERKLERMETERLQREAESVARREERLEARDSDESE